MSKKNTTPTPHDTVFRSFLESPEVARDFVSLHLPAEYRGLCDLSTLKVEPCTFVDEELKKFECDVLFSMKTTSGEDGYIYCLAEHQSTDNPVMAFRMLRYSVAAMQRHYKQHKKLPLVIPVLFYHGERSPYPYSMNWMECFDKPDIVAKIFTRPFHLVDLTVTDDDEFMHHRRMGALSLMMKHIRSRDLKMQMDRLVTLIHEHLDEGLALVLVKYLLNGGEHVTVEFLQALARRLPQHEGNIMTLAERLRHEGRDEGLQEGIQKGLLEGMEKGIQKGATDKALDIARQLQAMGMTPEQIMQATGLSEAELQKITH